MNLVMRIVRNGLFAAVILAVIGFGFAEIASLWMTSQSGRGAIGEAATAQSLRYRLPLGMAGWGFVFAALTEVGLHFWRRDRRPEPVAEQPAPASHPVPAAVLIEQILREAEAERQASPSPSQPTGSPGSN